MTKQEDIKAFLGEQAAKQVRKGQVVGLGTGSTASYFIRALGKRYASEKLEIGCIPTSEQSAKLAVSYQLPLLDLEKLNSIDIGVDGCDTILPSGLVIKGNGGALLKEKLVERIAKRLIYIADDSKLSQKTGFPIEILPFGAPQTISSLHNLGFEGQLRISSKKPLFTELGHLLFDVEKNPYSLTQAHHLVKALPGVIETGIFCDLSYEVWVADSKQGIQTLNYRERS